MQNTL